MIITWFMTNRFDLIYLILDKPDEQMDRRLAKHIVALHFEDIEVQLESVLLFIYSHQEHLRNIS